jgi:F0F1-type ATP synthase membrane subunit c/vacuolar-type H+-ATPase subunit K
MEVEAAKALAGGLVALPAIGSALGIGLYCMSYNNAISRNPEVKKLIDEKFFIAVAFIEALGIIPIGLAAYVLAS